MHKFFLTVLIGVLSFVSAQKPVNAVVTVGMIADVVGNVAGDCADVTTIMGAGIDPHLYQASSHDVRTFNNADIIFFSGYALEGQLGEVLERLSRRIPTVAVSERAISGDHLLQHAGEHGVDPHLWMDVSLWAKLAPVIAESLAELRPECAEAMQANAESYQAQQHALHEWIQEAIASIPEENRVLVTAHDAFSYYARVYGIRVEGIQGISTESEAAIADIRATADLIAESHVPAVFIETTINPRTIQAVIDAVAQRGHDVVIGGELFSDAMGEAGSYNGTYLGMLLSNTVTITKALGGTLPELPTELEEWAQNWSLSLDVLE